MTWNVYSVFFLVLFQNILQIYVIVCMCVLYRDALYSSYMTRHRSYISYSINEILSFQTFSYLFLILQIRWDYSWITCCRLWPQPFKHFWTFFALYKRTNCMHSICFCEPNFLSLLKLQWQMARHFFYNLLIALFRSWNIYTFLYFFYSSSPIPRYLVCYVSRHDLF